MSPNAGQAWLGYVTLLTDPPSFCAENAFFHEFRSPAMFSLSLDGSATFKVASRSGVSVFATDGSAPNPFEGALATIAACAGVYAHKACAAAGVDPTGIDIRLKPSAALGGFEIRRIAIQTRFPDGFPTELIPQVLDSIAACPVKSMIQHGDAIDFRIETAH